MDESSEDTGIWTKLELKREEIRGVFVIGLIATFLSIRPYIETHVSSQILINPESIKLILLNLTTFLIFFWGIYLFLIVISLSDDIILPVRIDGEPLISKEKFSVIKKVAQIMFMGGIGIVVIYALLLSILIELYILILLVLVLVLLSPIIIPYKLLKKFITKH